MRAHGGGAPAPQRTAEVAGTCSPAPTAATTGAATSRGASSARRATGGTPPANGMPSRLVVVDAAGLPGVPVASWPPAVPGTPFVPPSGRGSPRLTSTENSGRCPACGYAVRLRLDGRTIAHKKAVGDCPGSGELPASDVPLACWLPVKDGLTPHGLRHSHKTWMERRGVASDATFREKRKDTRPALQLPRHPQRAGRVRQQCGGDLRCHHPVVSTESMLQPLLLHPVTRIMRQMQRKAQRRGGMPLPPARQAQVFDRVGKPLPTSSEDGIPEILAEQRLGH